MKVKEFGHNIVTPTGIPKQNDPKIFQPTSDISSPTLQEVVQLLEESCKEAHELLDDVQASVGRTCILLVIKDFKQSLEALKEHIDDT